MRRKILAEGRPLGQPLLHRSVAEMRGFGAYEIELRFAAGAPGVAVKAAPGTFQEAIQIAKASAADAGADRYCITGEFGHERGW